MKRIKYFRTGIFFIVDILLINIAYVMASALIFSLDLLKENISSYSWSSLIITLIYLVCFYSFKLYKSSWNYAGFDEYVMLAMGCIISGFMAVIYNIFFKTSGSLIAIVLGGIFSSILLTGFRLYFRIYRRIIFTVNKADKSGFKRVIIVGAGSAGQIIAREMKYHLDMKYIPVAFVDDCKDKIGTIIAGIRVMGDIDSLKIIMENQNIDEIIIAIPSLNNEYKKKLIDKCRLTGCKIKIMPGIYELIEGKVSLKQIRDVEIEDLLGRESVQLDVESISNYLSGNTVMVTGGGGSIGSELCRQIARYNPGQLIILDEYENNVYDLQNEFKYDFPGLNTKIVIASIRDRKRVERIFEDLKPEIVFHAAAHKHVPLMENNPTEAIKNNVFGTLNIAECSDLYGVKRFVMISTDKAVNPTNIMGASKRICEMIIQAINKYSKTDFVAVRFGNVLGSNGSVVPLFKNQIAKGGPVTVTHRDITRYFMTISEAAQLVIQAGAFAGGGEIYILDMGKPVRIYDLAVDLIKLSGFEPEKDIKIEITGLRPGEKMFEELLMEEESVNKTRHEKIFVAPSSDISMEELKASLEELKQIVDCEDTDQLIRKVEKLVPTYKRAG